MNAKKKIAAALCAACLLCAASTPALAESPMQHSHQGGQAAVSQSVTNADASTNDGTNTHFFLFIENPIEASSLPKTGDSGLDLTNLLVAAIANGTGYLICKRYAQQDS